MPDRVGNREAEFCVGLRGHVDTVCSRGLRIQSGIQKVDSVLPAYRCVVFFKMKRCLILIR